MTIENTINMRVVMIIVIVVILVMALVRLVRFYIVMVIVTVLKLSPQLCHSRIWQETEQKYYIDAFLSE